MAARTKPASANTAPLPLELVARSHAPALEPFDPRRLSKAGVLEVMRIVSGASYQELGRKVGMRTTKVRRLLEGQYVKPPKADVACLFLLLFDMVPLRPRPRGATPPYAFLTVQEAAQAVSVTPAMMRRLVAREPAIGAVKVGRKIRVPREGLLSFFLGERPAARQVRGWTPLELAQVLRVDYHAIRRAYKAGRLRTVRKAPGGRITIPPNEVRRVLTRGLSPIELWGRDLSAAQRCKRAKARRVAREGKRS